MRHQSIDGLISLSKTGKVRFHVPARTFFSVGCRYNIISAYNAGLAYLENNFVTGLLWSSETQGIQLFLQRILMFVMEFLENHFFPKFSKQWLNNNRPIAAVYWVVNFQNQQVLWWASKLEFPWQQQEFDLRSIEFSQYRDGTFLPLASQILVAVKETTMWSVVRSIFPGGAKWFKVQNL